MYRGGVDQTWANIIAGVGTTADTVTTPTDCAFLQTSATLNQYGTLVRSFYSFDTSLIGTPSTVSDVIISIVGTGKVNAVGSPDFHIAGGTLTNSNALVTGDFVNRGVTSFGSVTYANFSTAGYNSITLNASGIANISKTGISVFSAQLSWDILSSFTGVWAGSQNTGFQAAYADTAGSTSDPKLTVTFARTVRIITNRMRPRPFAPGIAR